MLLRLLVILLLVFWVVPLIRRALAGRPPAPPRRADPIPPGRDDHLENLTRQDISDAEFEEFPPDK